jgi:hypothetical protein
MTSALAMCGSRNWVLLLRRSRVLTEQHAGSNECSSQEPGKIRPPLRVNFAISAGGERQGQKRRILKAVLPSAPLA